MTSQQAPASEPAPLLDIPAFLASIIKEFGDDRFLEGDCHTLAICLYRAFGAGQLWACHRRVTYSKEFKITFYSHMIYADTQGASWDIHGDKADVRWEENWTLDDGGRNEDGELVEFEWVQVQYQEVIGWLLEHHAEFDAELCDKISALASIPNDECLKNRDCIEADTPMTCL